MKKLLLFISSSIIMAGCGHRQQAGAETEVMQINIDRVHDSADDIEFKKYVEFEIKMHGLLARLGYTQQQAQHEIDSLQMQGFASWHMMPGWYFNYRKRRDSNFILPDSIVIRY